MSFSATGAHRPLQSKPKSNPFLRRTASSPFSSHPRRKPNQNGPSLKRARTEIGGDDSDDRLNNTGIVTSVPPANVKQDVLSLIRYIQANMFSQIPERGAGMNSTRIADVLNYRKHLPPIVSIAHLHALSESTTATEREIARLVQAGKLRRVTVVGRGRGGSSIGEGLVMTEDWERLVNDSDLDEAVKREYINVLHEHLSSAVVSATLFESSDISQLVSAGFMTSTSALSSSTELLSRPGAFSLGSLSLIASAGTPAATGSLAAIGGKGAVHDRGGGGSGLATSSQRKTTGDLTFSLPSTGSYLKLLTEARSHVLQLLVKSSPKYKESSRDMLRERWNGGIPPDDPASRAKRARGEWVGVLPGKTKKWKDFYGMGFGWILEECLGSGAVECFNTGSVGLGVRVI